jgi:hypothetical protein
MSNPFQKLLIEMAAGVPPRYLAAVAHEESGFDPKVVNGGATGLFQITPVVLKDYNTHHETNYQQSDLVDPILNTRIAVEHLHRILDLYSTIPALHPADWTDRRWVELLTLGWNAGPNGVARVVQEMSRAGVPPERTTVDTVHTAALAMGNRGHLKDEKHVRFARKIAARFLGDPEPVPGVSGGGAGAAVAFLAPIGALALGNSVLQSGRPSKRGEES